MEGVNLLSFGKFRQHIKVASGCQHLFLFFFDPRKTRLNRGKSSLQANRAK